MYIGICVAGGAGAEKARLAADMEVSGDEDWVDGVDEVWSGGE